MRDPRYDQLAEVLTGFSTRLQSGEKVLIDSFDAPPEIVIALIRKAREKGAIPLANLQGQVSDGNCSGGRREPVRIDG